MNLGITVIKGRRSVRQYKETPIPDEAMRDALECARQAPSARNVQPWIFVVVKNRDTLAALGDLADHGAFIADAQACIAVFGERDADYCLEDCCAATGQLMLGLWAHGVGSCWVAGARKGYAEAVRELLKVPDTYTLVSLVPAGYPADMKIPPKKKIEDIVFYEAWKG
jgi:nitroreductase